MRRISDEFLLNIAVICATLLGLLVVGMLFYVETGLRRLDHARDVFSPYIRAAARLTVTVYIVALAVSLALVALEPAWPRVVFASTGIAVLVALVDYTSRARTMGRIMGRAAWSLPQQILTWGWAVAVLAVPWILGGLRPNREELTWGVVLALLSGLLSTFGIVLSAFDIARFERAFEGPGHGQPDGSPATTEEGGRP